MRICGRRRRPRDSAATPAEASGSGAAWCAGGWRYGCRAAATTASWSRQGRAASPWSAEVPAWRSSLPGTSSPCWNG